MAGEVIVSFAVLVANEFSPPPLSCIEFASSTVQCSSNVDILAIFCVCCIGDGLFVDC